MGDQRKAAKAAEVIPYESIFPKEDAQKAVQRVNDEISEHQKQLERLRLFASDNVALINLVRKLPDDLSHEVMVPFAKVAFFPGRLIHTNEFLVLLGEGYYADQTAKQTVGVLKRRGQILESKVDAMNAVISDLKVRAEFYGATAGDSGEGMVEIREYEETPVEKKDESGSQEQDSSHTPKDRMARTTTCEREYAHVLARLDELEKAEHAAESIFDDENIDSEYNNSELQHSFSDNDHERLEPVIAQKSVSYIPQSRDGSYEIQVDKRSPSDINFKRKDASLLKQSDPTEGFLHVAAHEDKVEGKPLSKHKESQPEYETSTVISSQRKAFTGTIVEHSHGPASSSATPVSLITEKTSNPSKPLSRFRMQKSR